MPLYVYFLARCVWWNITFVLEEEAFQPDGTQGGDDSGTNNLPGFQAFALCIDLPPAFFQVDQHHLLVHLQGTLDMRTAEQKEPPQVSGQFWSFYSTQFCWYFHFQITETLFTVNVQKKPQNHT